MLIFMGIMKSRKHLVRDSKIERQGNHGATSIDPHPHVEELEEPVPADGVLVRQPSHRDKKGGSLGRGGFPGDSPGQLNWRGANVAGSQIG